MEKNLIKNITAKLKKCYRTNNIYELINSLGISIIEKNLPKDTKGKTLKNSFGDEFIFISNEILEHEKKFILAHELGHLILHDQITCYYYKNSYLSKDKLEFEANYFAMELLLPEKLYPYEIEGFSIDQLSIMYGIPKEILKYKIKDVRRNRIER